MTADEVISALIRHQSLACVKKYSKYNDISIEEIPSVEMPIYAHWMSLILLATDQLQLVVKVHFNDADIREMILKKYSSRKLKGSERDMIDGYINELLNLIGTNLKNTFQKVELKLGVSLPIVTRGFDNYFFESETTTAAPEASETSVIQTVDVWKLNIDSKHSLHLSFDADIVSKDIIEAIASLESTLDESEDDGNEDTDLEFL